MRTPIIAGNWKMNTLLDSARQLAGDVRRLTEQVRSREVVLIPPLVFLAPVASALRDSRIALGAQDCHYESTGAYTGAVSASMLSSLGVKYVLCGHSERRWVFGDDDHDVNKKLQAVLAENMSAVLCVGEKRSERAAGQTNEVIERQLRLGLEGVGREQCGQVVIAYEPVWAIGTGEVATPGQAQDVHAFIREWLETRFTADIAAGMRIQYGGSVKPENVDTLMSCNDIDGALVGGASLKPDSFSRIVKYVS